MGKPQHSDNKEALTTYKATTSEKDYSINYSRIHTDKEGEGPVGKEIETDGTEKKWDHEPTTEISTNGTSTTILTTNRTRQAMEYTSSEARQPGRDGMMNLYGKQEEEGENDVRTVQLGMLPLHDSTLQQNTTWIIPPLGQNGLPSIGTPSTVSTTFSMDDASLTEGTSELHQQLAMEKFLLPPLEGSPHESDASPWSTSSTKNNRTLPPRNGVLYNEFSPNIPELDTGQAVGSNIAQTQSGLGGESGTEHSHVHLYHKRTNSWEGRPKTVAARDEHTFSPSAKPFTVQNVTPPLQHYGNSGNVSSPQSRVASFRTDVGMLNHGGATHRQTPPPPHQLQQPRSFNPYTSPVRTPEKWQQKVAQQQQQYLQQQSQQQQQLHVPPLDNRVESQGSYATACATVGQHHQQPLGVGYEQPRVGTPTRGSRHQPSVGTSHQYYRQQHSPAGPTSRAGPSSRSSSEILKTLLRKKACLYEPGTSRAIALITWLVGRELALEYGYFSRQQLQSGVHSCVASKIDSGTITRTKVNRCMQIVLNSCFHYIIPRPDGTEESGTIFRDNFAKTAEDDSYQLRTLDYAWNDLVVEKETVLKAAEAAVEDGKGGPAGDHKRSPYSSPQSSPSTGSIGSRQRGGGVIPVDSEAGAKRAVLLCFNENVRAADDVFRCHNEFIRDAANGSKLQMSAQEWRSFFGKESITGILTAGADIWGEMSSNDIAKFRTTWCAKRYDHDHELCGFAHVDVCGGWLRRDTSKYSYRDEVCPSVSSVVDGAKCFVINECPDGVYCSYAHSKEEIYYHPKRYKTRICPAAGARSSKNCPLGIVCPHLHPADSVIHQSKHYSASDGRYGSAGQRQSGRHHHQDQQQSAAVAHAVSKHKAQAGSIPKGAPMLYVKPAPESEFDEQLGMPGLQNLFRRHCSVVTRHLRSSGGCKCCYSYFDDDTCDKEATDPKRSSPITVISPPKVRSK